MSSPLSPRDVDAIVEKVRACADADDMDGAWDGAARLREEQGREPTASWALLHLVRDKAFASERSAEVLGDVFASHAGDDKLLGALGEALEGAHDIRFLNAAPASAPVFVDIAERLRARALAVAGHAVEPVLLHGLATAARLLGRSWDNDAERAARRLIELRPDDWREHYDFGLFFKVRGRFAEGLAANQRAAALGGGDDEAVQWNLGICATGARDGATALAVWKALGQHIELGRFGLPEGGYDEVKVCLAERPLAERSAAEDDPGLEETIWIERLSPCHGIVRSALVEELGVDFGDVVLIDGAPITHHKYGDAQVPVFPHLVTLERPGYRIWPFVGTQARAGAIQALSKALPEDAVLYSHTEQLALLCKHCWESASVDHGSHGRVEHHVVRGKLCAPPSLAPAALRRALDDAVAASDGVRLFVPELSRLVGDHARAEVEMRRVEMVEGSRHSTPG